MTDVHWKPNVTVACVVERDGRFLMVEEESDGRIVLNQPAGHLEFGETLLDAVRRETLEETGWALTPTALVGIYRWTRPATATTYLRFVFVGQIHDDPATGRAPLDPDISNAGWYALTELRNSPERLRSPLVMRAIDDFLAGHRYPLALLSDVPQNQPT